MKVQSLLTAATAALVISAAHANPRIPDREIHAQLVHEEVDIRIAGDQAKVTGIYKFKNDARDFVNLMIYLPVYAKEGTPVEEMKPVFALPAGALQEARFIKAEWEKLDGNIKAFGELPQIEGQRVYWFMVPYLSQKPNQTEFTLNITYSQKLTGEKFIYTPLIPNQKKDHDYGSISISADRALSLKDSDKHDFVKKGSKLVIHPADKRAIIVSVAKPAQKLP